MTAAAITKATNQTCEVHVVESEEIGTVGVGEATIPSIRHFNRFLEIDEDDFLRKTNGTFKLAIQFVGWNGDESRYFHAFGPVGFNAGLATVQRWRRLKAEGREAAGELADYSVTACASQASRCHRVFSFGEARLPIDHAFHFDAALYGQYLRTLAEQRGAVRHGRNVKGHVLGDDGHVKALIFEEGDSVEGDFFIDCSGFRGLLIGGALGVDYEDWSHWLPCDRAIAVPSAVLPKLPPYTRATAHSAGWQWRIPLQHRTGNGIVYSSDFLTDAAAADTLLQSLPLPAAGEPRLLQFTTGRRKLFWKNNVVAIGLSSGFLEPLESTSIHLIQTAIEKLLGLFPDRSFRQADIDYYNRITALEYEQIRDFIVLHYLANDRRGEPFWDARRSQPIPDSLSDRIELYKGCGRVFRTQDELFSPLSWSAVFEGQGLHPETIDPMISALPIDLIEGQLRQVREFVAGGVAAMPEHAAFLRECTHRADKGRAAVH
jgi:tryptophan halogenase